MGAAYVAARTRAVKLGARPGDRPVDRLARLAYAREVARLAVRSLYQELCLYPKPGLVSLVDSGSHEDMDAVTFMRSLFSLRRYFKNICLAGWDDAPFARLKQLGIAAEASMLKATRGINTHRGAIFSLGMLCATAGRARAQGTPMTPAALRAAMLIRWGEELAMHAAPIAPATLAPPRTPVAPAAQAPLAAPGAPAAPTSPAAPTPLAAPGASAAPTSPAALTPLAAPGASAALTSPAALMPLAAPGASAALTSPAALMPLAAPGASAALAAPTALAASGASVARIGQVAPAALAASPASDGALVSNGLRVAARYAVSGAREEGALGLPSVFEFGVPALQASRARGASMTHARIDTLFALMAHISDSNVYHRAGPQGAQTVREHARRFIDAGGTANADWQTSALESHRIFVEQRLSPGGAADLLAASCLVLAIATLK